jgi:hypothetical protein
MLLDMAEAGNARSLDAIWMRRVRLNYQLVRIRLLAELHFSGFADVQAEIAEAYRGLQAASSSSSRSAFISA